ncbi:glutamate--tRNA ligase [Pyrococcus abyssi]|uniref:Glutamate--tRNA ligase n=1 Tax=Pyrococcus abyssi (strain GE5 / Orsay) TaxID=272844 RepID=SYE_PYRAB|nr:glutamate--tRNA ligase [Pyrococcus abyssi]Q9V1E3.1 RecName: Full=Glutamate--tRNA ligase; AltName: Full=Glutamyl-tRNA synthetase; Short=GluRS [Pyrococcus abyssi GE5]CAB49406.1 gltX glutamyl-tRNA synthetase [Pyrococcus abyssi GE5]CCE69868.1 TPA: glutamyl-tRNA synthetase [Pyrococcus abyssi GE5]
MEVERIALKYALINAIEHGGKANPKAVIGKVLGENPELRSKAREIVPIINKVVEEVNSLSLDEQKAKLMEIYPEYFEKKEEKKEEKKGLPPLPKAEKGKVVTRFAPNPDGAFHLGNARAAILSYEYAKMYGGKFILRFDDTDPKVKRPEPIFYEMIIEDLEWLGIKPDEIVYASDRLELYYKYAEELIKMGKAYVCTCKPEKFRELRDKGIPCPHRDEPVEVQLERWRKMLNGEYKEGEAVVRIKTDLNHPNPAVRDWPALRIVDNPNHPRAGNKYRVWPLYNFASAIDDHELGVTHIFRGQEHAENETRQRYIYEYFGWEYPVTVHHGRLSIEGVILSKSKTRKGIEEGKYLGWDDPRLGTIRALRRRGILPEAIKELIIEVGLKKSDATVSWDNLAAINRKLVDPIANRYFFVADPVPMEVEGAPEFIAKIPLHPDHPERGTRELRFTPGKPIYVSKDDLDLLKPGSFVRLKDLFNVEIVEVGEKIKAKFHSFEYEIARKNKWRMIHWVPEGRPCEVIIPEGDELIVRKGLLEKDANVKAGEIVQFERFGFVRIDKIEGEKVVAIYAHK